MRIFALLSLVALLVGGCAGLNDGAAGTNRVTVLLTGSAAPSVSVAAQPEGPTPDALHVTFGRVDLVPAEETGGGVITVYDGDPVTYDVLSLTDGTTAELGQAVDVPPGTYDQVRFIVERATLSFCDDVDPDSCEVFDVFVPSGAQTGIKVNVQPPLILADGANQTLIVDFDVERAIVETPPGSGNYLLKPTALRVISEAGAFEGRVQDVEQIGLEGVSVEVYPAGLTEAERNEGNLVVATSSDGDGYFAFIALLAGPYDLSFSLDGYQSASVEDVEVVVGETTSPGPVTLEQTVTD